MADARHLQATDSQTEHVKSPLCGTKSLCHRRQIWQRQTAIGLLAKQGSVADVWRLELWNRLFGHTNAVMETLTSFTPVSVWLLRAQPMFSAQVNLGQARGDCGSDASDHWRVACSCCTSSVKNAYLLQNSKISNAEPTASVQCGGKMVGRKTTRREIPLPSVLFCKCTYFDKVQNTKFLLTLV